MHAPAWGATLVIAVSVLSRRFNPRARMGRDGRRHRKSTWNRSFNPRARMGRDDLRELHRSTWVFQSTRPHGARPAHATSSHASSGFNPRARMGRDCPTGLIGSLNGFNPRARTGRDGKCRDDGAIEGVSIHAPARGATPDVRISTQRVVSIHAPAWGATSRAVSCCSRP